MHSHLYKGYKGEDTWALDSSRWYAWWRFPLSQVDMVPHGGIFQTRTIVRIYWGMNIKWHVMYECASIVQLWSIAKWLMDTCQCVVDLEIKFMKNMIFTTDYSWIWIIIRNKCHHLLHLEMFLDFSPRLIFECHFFLDKWCWILLSLNYRMIVERYRN